MYKEKLLSSLATGDITDLQQKALQQEFIAAVEKADFTVFQCSRQNLLCRYKESDNIFLSLITNQTLRPESEAPAAQTWGSWCICDRNAQPLQLPASGGPAGCKNNKEFRCCTGFWLEGTENIGCFIKTYLRHTT